MADVWMNVFVIVRECFRGEVGVGDGKGKIHTRDDKPVQNFLLRTSILGSSRSFLSCLLHILLLFNKKAKFQVFIAIKVKIKWGLWRYSLIIKHFL